MTLRVPQNVIEQLDVLANMAGKTRNSIAAQAIKEFIGRESWRVQEILQAITEADAGDFATDENVQALKAKWSSNAN